MTAKGRWTPKRQGAGRLSPRALAAAKKRAEAVRLRITGVTSTGLPSVWWKEIIFRSRITWEVKMAWAKGDIVRLKSGGPTMTVQMVTAGKVVCSWFDSDQKLQNGTFAADGLVKYDPPIVTPPERK